MCALRLRSTIFCYGDSLTQMGWGGLTANGDYEVGWVSLLASAYTRRADVINRGFSGYTTRDCLELLPKMWNSSNDGSSSILFSTIWLGANDATIAGDVQHVPIDDYATNLRKIVQSIRQETTRDMPIILLSPPPVWEPIWALQYGKNESNRTNQNAREYGIKVQEIADSEPNCEFIDTWQLLQGDSDDRQDYLSDGLHLNQKGNIAVYRGLMSLIKSKYPDLYPTDGTGRGIKMEEKLWQDLYDEN